MIIQGVLFAGIGVFTAGCAAADFDWFMNSRRAALFVWMFGRNGARVVYGLMGGAFIMGGIAIMFITP